MIDVLTTKQKVHVVEFFYNFTFNQWESADNLREFPNRWGLMFVGEEYVPAKISSHRCNWVGKDLQRLEMETRIPTPPDPSIETLLWNKTERVVTHWIDVFHEGSLVEFLKLMDV